MPDPWRAPCFDLQRRLDEIFEELIYRRWAIPNPTEWRPPLDLHETRDAYLAEIDLPGVSPDQLEIRVMEGGVAITGNRPETGPEGALLSHRERPCGLFRRSLTLAQPIDPEGAWAECRHGTYRLWLPKRSPAERPAPEVAPAEPGAARVIRVVIR